MRFISELARYSNSEVSGVRAVCACHSLTVNESLIKCLKSR